MAQFILKIKLGNAAMLTGNDVAKALQVIGIQINSNDAPFGKRDIRDINGNVVGSWMVK